MDTRTSTARLRLARIRDALQRHGLDAVLVPSSDPHLSEYLPERWQARRWLSGFSGSMGTLVVTRTQAALFADSRYWTQAEGELAGSGIALVKIPTGASTLHLDWLAREMASGQALAVDGQVIGLAAAQALRAALTAAGVTLRTDLDLFTEAWDDRPALPAAPVFEHLAPHAPLARADKLAQLRAAMAAHGTTQHFVSTLDDIAWLFNLRGGDVSYNPVFLAHALIGAQGSDGPPRASLTPSGGGPGAARTWEPSDTATLFVADGKIDAALRARLAADGVTLAPYAQAAAALAALPATATLLIDPKRVTLGLREQVPAAVRVVEAINPSTLAKSRKSDAEAAHVRAAMEMDGAAMCEFYAWFEAALARGERLTEIDVGERLAEARARQPDLRGTSFGTIAGFNANGALPHYHATPETNAVIAGNGLLLIDSGGQYLGGTTDITRVWPIGNVSAAMKRDVTLVLKGTLALSRAHFPRGTPSPMLDAIARAPLWAESLDYGHGTGHGVGYFLNVHEGPQSISKTVPDAHMAMEPGMITSIEPGLYRVGQWGVRIENLVLNTPAAPSEFGEFLEFETLTLCPIDTRCIERNLMRTDEIDWLNAYHAEVLRRLAPRVSGDALAWLEARTRAL